MIKYFCDRCGKEIKDKVHTDIESTEARDCHDNIVTTFTNIMHYCDECQYEEFSCGFKVGDKVMASDGRTGVITDICTCDQCKKRGFYEPTIKFSNGDQDYIMISEKENGFKSFYQIGNRVFGNLDEEAVRKAIRYRDNEIRKLSEERNELRKQLDVVLNLKEMNEK